MSEDGIRIKLELNAHGAEKSFANLLGFIKSGKLMEAVGEEVAQFSQRRISSRRDTAPDGSKWAPLSPAYLLFKKKTHPHQGTLQRENTMMEGILAHLAGEGQVDVGVGSNMLYGLIHQFGGKAGRGRKATIPARPYIGISEQEKATLERRVGDWMKDRLAGGK